MPGEILQQFMPDDRVALHDLLFDRVEASGLVEDRQGNAGLSDVMQGCRHSEPLDVRIGEPEVQREADRHACYQQAMLERSFVIPANVVQPRAKPILSDAVDDLRCGVFGI